MLTVAGLPIVVGAIGVMLAVEWYLAAGILLLILWPAAGGTRATGLRREDRS
jgi:hypothetical protein